MNFLFILALIAFIWYKLHNSRLREDEQNARLDRLENEVRRLKALQQQPVTDPSETHLQEEPEPTPPPATLFDEISTIAKAVRQPEQQDIIPNPEPVAPPVLAEAVSPSPTLSQDITPTENSGKAYYSEEDISLSQQLNNIEETLQQPEQDAPVCEPPLEHEELEATINPAISPASVSAMPHSANTLEQRIGSRWLVWLGGLSLILGGGYFVSYAIEQEWITIGMQMVGATLFGLCLFGLGEKMRRMPTYQESDGKAASLPQSIAAAGAGIMFASIYASYDFFHLISSTLALSGLASVCLATLLASLRQGQVMAVLGLIGGYIAPALVSTPQDSVLLLVLYLLGLTTLAEIINRKRNWIALHYIGVAANMLWAIAPISDPTPALQLIMPTYLLGCAALYAVRIARQDIGVGLMLGMMLLKLFYLNSQTFDLLQTGAFDTRSALVLAGFAVPMLAGLLQRTSFGSAIAALYALATTTILALTQWEILPSTEILTVTFVVALLADAARRGKESDAPAQIAAMVPLGCVMLLWTLGGHFAHSDFWTWTFLGFTGLAGTAHLVSSRKGNEDKIIPGILLMQAMAGLLLATISHFNAGGNLTLVLTIYVPMLAWVCRRNPHLSGVFLIYCAYTAFRSLFLSDLMTASLQEGGLIWIGETLALPLLAYLSAAWMLRTESRYKPAQALLQIVAVAYAVLLPFALTRYFEGAEAMLSIPMSFREASLVSILWLLLATALTSIKPVSTTWVARAIAGAMGLFATSLLVFGPLLSINPLGSTDPVSSMDLLLGYAVPALLFGGLLYRAEKLGYKPVAHFAGGLCTAFALMFVTLEALHLRWGGPLDGPFGLMESTLLGTLWTLIAIATQRYRPLQQHEVARWMIKVPEVLGMLTLAYFNLALFNPFNWHITLSAMPLLNELVPAYALPMALALYIAQEYRKTAENSIGLKTYSVLALLFGLSFTAYDVLHLLRGPSLIGDLNFKEAAVIGLLWLGSAGGLYSRTAIRSDAFRLRLTAILGGLGTLTLTVFPLLLVNPLWQEKTSVGTLPVLDWLFLAYGLPTLALGAAAFILSRQSDDKKRFAPFAAGAGVFYLLVWISLEVRHLFHGEYLPGLMTDTEWYTYSATWLISGFSLLAVGVWQRSKVIRHAALALILLTVAKVFLSDMSSLHGLLRAGSFMGLGLALMGVGYLYQRFVMGAADEKQEG